MCQYTLLRLQWLLSICAFVMFAWELLTAFFHHGHFLRVLSAVAYLWCYAWKRFDHRYMHIVSHTLVRAQAQRLLLRSALQDPLNQRFVFLSEACAPLIPAATMYAQLMSEPKSRINACNKPDWDRNLDRSAAARHLASAVLHPSLYSTFEAQIAVLAGVTAQYGWRE